MGSLGVCDLTSGRKRLERNRRRRVTASQEKLFGLTELLGNGTGFCNSPTACRAKVAEARDGLSGKKLRELRRDVSGSGMQVRAVLFGFRFVRSAINVSPDETWL
jgi:hypothetical protein